MDAGDFIYPSLNINLITNTFLLKLVSNNFCSQNIFSI